MLACGTSMEEERNEENLPQNSPVSAGFDYTFSCQTWKVIGHGHTPEEEARNLKGAMQEEGPRKAPYHFVSVFSH
jgi:hypothetical protein